MPDPTQFQTLFAYHWHTTDRLITCATHLDEQDYRENPGYGHGSIHDLLFHLLRTTVGWRGALETGKQLAPLNAEDYPSLATLQAGMAQEHAAWDNLLAQWDAADLQGKMDLTNWRGEVVTFTRWRILQHLILHGMQHHSELAQLLTNKGQSPGNLDFIFFV